MRLNNIYINNFGIYNGSYEYDLSVTPDRNVVLISGRNGSGKTTLLNVVKLSIYGPKLFGSPTTQNKQYLSYIHSNLNAFARHDGKTDYKIGIDFSMFYANSFKDFSITRSWLFQDDQLKELTSISIDGIPVDDKEITLTLDIIHREIPKTLFELFFFDGEKISDMFNLKHDLTDMLNYVYNLNLFLDLKKDLKVYKRRNSTTKELTECENAILQVEDDLEVLSHKIVYLEEKLSTESARLDTLEEQLQVTKESFQASGGLNSTEQIELKKEITRLELQKLELENKYKQLVEYLPFIMMSPQIKQLATQVKRESDSKKYNIISSAMDQDELKDYLNITLKYPNIENILGAIKDFAISKCFDDSHYDLSPNEEFLLNKVLTLSKQLSYEDFEICINGISNINIQLRSLNTQLEESTSEELKKYSSKISSISNEIGNAQTTLQTLVIKKASYLTQQKELNYKLSDLQKLRKDLHKEDNLENVIFKIETVIEEYSKRLKLKKQKQFEEVISTMFTTLIRKEDFISGIKLNEETGEIQLFNKLGGILPRENLSAGERQIYVLSILYGIISLSKNKVPLVFDTLLGRLDHTHKTHIIDSFIKNCGEQVIILATDTEIDEQYLALLKPMMNNYYKIDYDSINNTVTHREISLD